MNVESGHDFLRVTVVYGKEGLNQCTGPVSEADSEYSFIGGVIPANH